MNRVFQEIVELISSHHIPYRHIQHEPTYSSEESAKARGESLDTGAKAILMKGDETFSLFVISASKKIDSKKIKNFLHVSSLRFATAEELLELTSLVPGSVPPFGNPVLPFPLYVDHSIETLARVAFNAGSLTESIVMDAKDYLQLCNGTVFSFSKNGS
ncbi:MAG: hypothetical protein JSS61_05270 [Verrucomicrobia bacterium]|nr:hypothetical protein [Verrucomicrobiota bacterium]